MRYLIFGGTGTFGTALRQYLTNSLNYRATPAPNRYVDTSTQGCSNDIEFLSSADCDIREERAVRDIFKDRKPDLVVNAAAMTDLLECEKNPTKALEINSDAAVRLHAHCYNRGITFVHLSTDYVYPGNRGWYKENDYHAVSAGINAYTRTKHSAEYRLLAYKHVLIIRTSFFPAWDKWPYASAFNDQWTSRERIDKLIPELWLAINSQLIGALNVSLGHRWSVHKMASTYYPEARLKEGSRHEVYRNTGLMLPADTSLDIARWKEWKMRTKQPTTAVHPA